MEIEKKQTNDVESGTPRDADVRRIRVLWFGLGIYFLVMLNAFRFAYRVPYQILILGGLINFAIIVAIVVSLKRAYRRLRK